MSAEYGWTDEQILNLTFERITKAIEYIMRRQGYQRAMDVVITHSSEPQKLADTFWKQAFKGKKQKSKELTKEEAMKFFNMLGMPVRIKKIKK